MDLRPVLYILGLFLCVLAIAMAVPAAVDIYMNHNDWVAFAISMGISCFVGALLILSNKQKNIHITGRQAFLLTAMSWILLCLFSALPFILALPDMSVTDAIFESVSGLTTTGATVMTGLDTMPPGLLIWRALLQWLGGIGIIVMAISVLPFLKIGGMQLFRLESSEKEKALPRATELAGHIVAIYVGLSILCTLAYIGVGMSVFDAVAHAMTTIATGGYSTRDSSFGAFEQVGPEIVAIIFMILGCLPFVLYIKMLGGNFRALFQDDQVRGFIKTLFVAGVVMVSYLWMTQDMDGIPLLIKSIFTTTSLITGTGYTNTDYMQWGGFAVGFLLFISSIGGCAGSTTCGIKIFRFQIMYAVAKNQIQQLIHPNAVYPIDYNHQPLSVQVAGSVMAFFFIFAMSFAIVSLSLLCVGLDITTALSGAMASLANVGPGLGDIIGPTGTYQSLGDEAKWILSFAMILGRLEFFTLLVFFMPRFWRL